MALSILEKVGLQKQAATLKSELKAGELGILDKLAKQRELAAIMAKLKGDAVKPAPAEVDEEGSDQEAEEATRRSLVGLAIGGVQHPAWTKVYEKSSKATALVSNETLGVVILWATEQGAERDAFKIGYSGWSADQAFPAENAWKGIKSYFPADKRKKVRYMVEQAIRAAKDIYKNGVGDYSIAKWSYGAVQLGYKGQVFVEGTATLGPALDVAYANLKYQHRGMEGVMESIADGNTAASLTLLGGEVLSAEMGRAKPISIEDFERFVEALPAEDQERYSQILDGLRTRVAALKQEPEQEQVPEETLSMRYLRGDFNQESPVDFRKRILAVADEGMALDDVKAGVTRWIEANPELIAA